MWERRWMFEKRAKIRSVSPRSPTKQHKPELLFFGIFGSPRTPKLNFLRWSSATETPNFYLSYCAVTVSSVCQLRLILHHIMTPFTNTCFSTSSTVPVLYVNPATENFRFFFTRISKSTCARQESPNQVVPGRRKEDGSLKKRTNNVSPSQPLFE